MGGLLSKLDFPEFMEVANDYDILCLSETHFDEFDKPVIPGFQYITKNRKKISRKSGGLLFAARDDIFDNFE